MHNVSEEVTLADPGTNNLTARSTLLSKNKRLPIKQFSFFKNHWWQFRNSNAIQRKLPWNARTLYALLMSSALKTWQRRCPMLIVHSLYDHGIFDRSNDGNGSATPDYSENRFNFRFTADSPTWDAHTCLNIRMSRKPYISESRTDFSQSFRTMGS
jgi:hypothetical protein